MVGGVTVGGGCDGEVGCGPSSEGVYRRGDGESGSRNRGVVDGLDLLDEYGKEVSSKVTCREMKIFPVESSRHR